MEADYDTLPDSWVVQTVDGHTKYHKIVVLGVVPTCHILTHTLTEGVGRNLHVEVLGRHLNKESTPALRVLDSLPKKASLKQKVHIVNKLKVCSGNSDPSLLKLADKMGRFYNISIDIVANIESDHMYTIRHVNCAILLQEGTRCPACSKHRRYLQVKHSRQRRRLHKGT